MEKERVKIYISLYEDSSL